MNAPFLAYLDKCGYKKKDSLSKEQLVVVVSEQFVAEVFSNAEDKQTLSDRLYLILWVLDYCMTHIEIGPAVALDIAIRLRGLGTLDQPDRDSVVKAVYRQIDHYDMCDDANGRKRRAYTWRYGQYDEEIFPLALKHYLFLHGGDLEVSQRFKVPQSASWPKAYHGYKLGRAVKNFRAGANCIKLHDEEAILALGIKRTVDGAQRIGASRAAAEEKMKHKKHKASS